MVSSVLCSIYTLLLLLPISILPLYSLFLLRILQRRIRFPFPSRSLLVLRRSRMNRILQTCLLALSFADCLDERWDGNGMWLEERLVRSWVEILVDWMRRGMEWICPGSYSQVGRLVERLLHFL